MTTALIILWGVVMIQLLLYRSLGKQLDRVESNFERYRRVAAEQAFERRMGEADYDLVAAKADIRRIRAELEMLDPMVDNHERALQANTGLHILHAAQLTDLQSKLDSLRADVKSKFFVAPVRKDN